MKSKDMLVDTNFVYSSDKRTHYIQNLPIIVVPPSQQSDKSVKVSGIQVRNSKPSSDLMQDERNDLASGWGNPRSICQRTKIKVENAV
jgi:hypothetical protein